MSGGILFIEAGAGEQRDVFARDGVALWADGLPIVLEKHGLLDVRVAGPEVLHDPRSLAAADVVLISRIASASWDEHALDALRESRVHALIDGPLPPAVEQALQLGSSGRADEHELPILAACDAALRASTARYADTFRGRICGESRPLLDIRPDLLWTELPDVPIATEQATAWRRSDLGVREWSQVSGPAVVLAELTDDRGEGLSLPAIVQTGSVIACCFDFFSLLAHRHTARPIARGEWVIQPSTLGLEAILLGSIDLLYARALAVRPRILPWPGGKRQVQVIRQPIDARAESPAIAEQLHRFGRLGRAATWLCAPSAAKSPAIDEISQTEHQEVALLAEQVWSAPRHDVDAFRAVFEHDPAGAFFGSSRDSFRYQGAPNVLWAERMGMQYVDVPGSGHLHPHRLALLESDGTVRPSALLAVPGGESLGGFRTGEGLGRTVDRWRAASGLLSLEAAPLVEAAARSDAIEEIPVGPDDIVDWTLAEAVRWWSLTHVEGALRLSAVGDGRFELAAPEEIGEVTIELLAPDGTVDLTVAQPRREPTLVGRSLTPLAQWERRTDDIAGALETYWRARRAHATPEQRGALLAANTAAVPGRQAYLKSLLEELCGREGWGDLTVLLIDAGLGTLACYLAIAEDPYLVVTMTRDELRYDTAREVVSALGMSERVEVVRRVLPSLAFIDDRSIDVVVADNALHLVDERQLGSAISEIRRVLRPDGHLLAYETLHQDSASGSPPLPLDRLQARLRKDFELSIVRYGGGGRLSEDQPSSAMTAFAVGAARRGAGEAATRTLRARPRARADVGTWVKSPEQIAEVFGDAVSQSLSATGRDLTSAAAQSTLRINTVQIPNRGQVLLGVVRQLVGHETLAGLRVLEVGAGFGGLAAYLAWHERPAALVGIDISASYVELASQCAARLGLEPILKFQVADMRDLSAFDDGAFDLIYANNAFIYLPEKTGVDEALAEFHRVLAAGGNVVFYQANRWRWTEPFTRDPLVHLMPAPLADAVARVTGFQHNHGRVMLHSPPGMRRALGRAGFEPTPPLSFRHGPVSRWPARNFGTFFGIAGRKR